MKALHFIHRLAATFFSLLVLLAFFGCIILGISILFQTLGIVTTQAILITLLVVLFIAVFMTPDEDGL